MVRFALPLAGVLALSSLSACGDDGGSDTTTTTTTTTTEGTVSESGSSSSDSSTSTTDDPTTGISTTTDDSTTGPDPTTSEGTTTGPVNMCDPVIPGEWNSCVGDNDQIDNTLCNWMGVPDAVGFIGCLSSSSNETANVCMITGCEDECDCFAPPATGNAPVACADVLAGGGLACVLTCDQGETCPDTMECIDGLCFHPM